MEPRPLTESTGTYRRGTCPFCSISILWVGLRRDQQSARAIMITSTARPLETEAQSRLLGFLITVRDHDQADHDQAIRSQSLLTFACLPVQPCGLLPLTRWQVGGCRLLTRRRGRATPKWPTVPLHYQCNTVTAFTNRPIHWKG